MPKSTGNRREVLFDDIRSNGLSITVWPGSWTDSKVKRNPDRICKAKENAMSDITSHRRVNDILLGPLERPTLRWLQPTCRPG